MTLHGKMVFLFLDKRGKTCYRWSGDRGCIMLGRVFVGGVVFEIVDLDSGMIGELFWVQVHLNEKIK